ncbi:MAG: tRNA-dihydrouridine synthase, partial [Duncaniella sp.]|nr:tRNA-dihydrouridine synthase [Duncaniella sp.]
GKEYPRVEMPFFGNRDITTPDAAREAFDRYGVDGVMVGRASIGAPWIFHDIRAAIDGNSTEPLSVAQRFDLIRRQIRESIDRIDEYRGILHIRRHLAASPLFKGISHFRDTRIRMLRASTFDELMEILAQVEQLISEQSL